MDLNDLANNPDRIKELISLLQSLLPTEDKKNPTAETSQNQKIKTRGPRKKTDSQKHINKFEKMPEFAMHKDDIAIDVALSKHPPVGRMREFEMIDVVCRICGKKETINPALLFDSHSRYKCNNCSTQAG